MIRMGYAVYTQDIATGRMIFSPGSGKLFSVRQDSLPSNLDAFSRLMLEQDRRDRGLKISETIKNGTAAEFEYRLRLGDGSVAWIEDRFHLIEEEGKSGVLSGVMRIVTDRKEREMRLAFMASQDELTGHFNRIRLRERLSHALAYTKRYNVPVVYMVIGIDHLRRTNEAYGFDVADEVIVEVGKRIKNTLRSGDVIGRVAGTKFGIILTECTEAKIASTAERLLKLIRSEVVDSRAGPIPVTISIGGVVLPGTAENAHDAMANAEEALVKARQGGRDCFVSYRPSFQILSERKRNIAIAEQIMRALNENRVKIAYQPIVHAVTNEPVMYECLARLVRENGEEVLAADFIPVAEKLGLVQLLDKRISELAIETLSKHPDVHLTLNVSGMTASEPQWLRNFLRLIQMNVDVAERLVVEITETVAIRDIEESMRFVSTLRDLGCKVAVDDFGAGYTSFSNLKSLTMDMVKLDGGYIKGIDRSEDNRFFVKTLMSLAQNFNLATVAEMVGNEQEADILRSYGVEYFQGFHYGKPSIIEPWLNKPAIVISA